MEDNYQMVSKKEYYEYIYPIIDKRAKPNLSNAALETLAIIAYNPRITRAEIESIRGVEASASLYKLPDLPRYKLDENKQIIIDEIIEEQDEKNETNKEEQEEVEMQDKEKVENIEK